MITGGGRIERLLEEMKVTLPCTMNGQIAPGEMNRYRFQAKKGQRLVICAQARDLVPYVADGVPGWFQAVMRLTDDKGNELAYNDDFRSNPDPLLYYEVPEDGEYVLTINEALFRGRESFVYRITIGELPFVTSIFPLGGRVGEPHAVKLKGWNLAGTTQATTVMYPKRKAGQRRLLVSRRTTASATRRSTPARPERWPRPRPACISRRTCCSPCASGG